jgi:hypothetical protein
MAREDGARLGVQLVQKQLSAARALPDAVDVRRLIVLP